MTGYRAITRARKIVFWISALAFVLTWPLLVMYALGIVISPSSKVPVVETGVIRVESLPGGARLLLDGKDTGKTTPAAVERLKAGTYGVELQKNGYKDWHAEVSVDIQAVRRVSYAVMVPRIPKTRFLPLGGYSSATLSENSQFLILPGRTVGELRVFDLRTERFLGHSPALAPYTEDPVEGFSSLPWGGIVMIHVVHDARKEVLVVHMGALGMDLDHVVDAPFFQTVDFAWSPTLSGSVYYTRGDGLWKMETWASGAESYLAGMVRSVGIVNNTFYYIDSRGSLGDISAFGRPHVLFTIPEKARGALTGGAKIEYATDSWGATLTPTGTFLLFRDNEFSEYHGIRGVSVDKGRDRFLVWSDRRVGSLSFPASGRPIEGAIDWAPFPPTQAAISSVKPAAGGSNCLFISDGSVWIEPVLSGVVGNAQAVVTLSPGEHYLYSEATGILLIGDPAIGRMRAIRFINRPLLPSLE